MGAAPRVSSVEAMIRPVAALLVVYSGLVAHLTLTDPSQGRWAFSLADRVAVRVSGGALSWTETEVLANVALFVPLGFLLALAFARVWPAVTACLVASAGIEWAQAAYLPSRVPSSADVLHNTAGGLVGAVLAGLVMAVASSAGRVRAA